MFNKNFHCTLFFITISAILLFNHNIGKSAVATCTQEETIKIEGMAGTFPKIIQEFIDTLKNANSCNNCEDFYGENTLFLYGPRGNGKTFLAEKIAQASHAELQKFQLSGLDLAVTAIQEAAGSQTNQPGSFFKIRSVFAEAVEYTKNADTCAIILIDEIDHILTNKLLLSLIRLEIDKIKNNPKILVIITTNKEPKEFDATFQSRFPAHCQIKIENPTEQMREEVLKFYWQKLIKDIPLNEQVLKNIATKSNGLPIRTLQDLIVNSIFDIKTSNQGISHETILLKNLALAKKAEADKKSYEKAVEDSLKKGFLPPEIKAGLITAGTGIAVSGTYEFLKSEKGHQAIAYLANKAKDAYTVIIQYI